MPLGSIGRALLMRVDGRWPARATRLQNLLRAHDDHVVKRARAARTSIYLDRLVALCPACHAQTDAPYGRGRLVITPLGQGQFTFTVVRGTDKWATRG
jgi:hypothetical protein